MASRRRGKGEGSIYRRESDGRWVGVVSFEDGTGKRRRKSVYGTTRKAVAEQIASLQNDARFGKRPVDDRKTLGAFLDEWLEMVKANPEHTTYLGYEQRVRLHIKPALGRKKLPSSRPRTCSGSSTPSCATACRRGRCSTSTRRCAPRSASWSAGDWCIATWHG